MIVSLVGREVVGGGGDFLCSTLWVLHIGYWRYMLVMVSKDYFAPLGLGFLVGAGPRVTLRSTLGYPISPRWGFGKVDCLPGPTLGAQDKLPYRHAKTGCTLVPRTITRPPFPTPKSGKSNPGPLPRDCVPNPPFRSPNGAECDSPGQRPGLGDPQKT